MSADPVLRLELDRPAHFHAPREKLTGTLHIEETGETWRAAEIRISSGWRSTGLAEPGPHEGEGDAVQARKVAIGTRGREHAFSLDVRDGPPTHRKGPVTVSWFVEGSVELPDGRVLAAEREFVQVVGERKRVKRGKDMKGGNPGLAETTLAGNVGCTVGCLAFFAFFPALGFALLSEGAHRETAIWLLAAVVVAFVVGQAVMRLNTRVASWRLGSAKVKLRPATAVPGAPVLAELTLRPRTTLTINAITARLVRQETTDSGTRKAIIKKTVRHVAVETELLPEGRTIAAGAPLEIATILTLPPDATPSLAKRRSRLEWLVTIDVDIAGWPDHHEVSVLGVVAP